LLITDETTLASRTFAHWIAGLRPRLIALGGIGQPDDIRNIETWDKIMGQYEHGRAK
jgi:hypothetical protein